jgi:molybdate transport system substrate-binding protein
MLNMVMGRIFVRLFAFTVVMACAGRASAAEADARVAVAANFTAAMQTIAAEFAKETGRNAQVVPGATGTLYAQIENGAPFDVFLSADEATPAKLEDEGLGVAGTRFTYSVGKLVLWSARAGYVDGAGAVLRQGRYAHLAMANPRVAPYGQAAAQALEALGLTDAVRPKIVLGENVAQAAQFVSSGAAELGFVALSQITGPGAPAGGSSWVVPDRLYTPIRQAAVLLRHGAANPAARALCTYLKTRKAREIIASFGYGVEAAP